MALRVWLPLNGNLLNKGCSALTFSALTANTATNTSGKIGSCYGNNSYTAGGLCSDNTISLGQKQSMFCWFKFTSLNSGSALGGTLVSQHRYATNSGMGITIRYASDSTGYLSVNTGNGSSRTYITYYGTTLLQANTWYHGGYTYDGSTIRIYVNGVCEKEQAFTGMYVPADYIMAFCWSFNASTGSAVYANYKLNGYLNDVRVYDHCLSLAEIKELAKGLCIHYKLDDFYNMNNLIVNGNGDLGSENWYNGNISTTEIPSGHSEIKASFYSGNRTTHLIPIIKTHSYTMSGYVKAISGASGTVYPSIMPYDVDMKFIANYHTADGFGTPYRTTLAQPLKKGDTVIYATDLSAWTTATNNYFYHVAIFGYKDSCGNVYPDMVYTQDSPVFGTYSDKSHINKTNNTITLNSAFTGEDRPAGTAICQATEGSTYYYPWGGVNTASVSSWTEKSGTFTPANANRLKSMAYMYWYVNTGLYIAGNKLVDNTATGTQIVDSSGFGNHATKTNSISTSYNTPRYEFSVVFNEALTTYIDIINNMFPVVLNAAFTISMWVYNSDAGGRSILFGNYGLTGSFFNIEKTTDEKIRFYWNSSPDTTFNNSILTSNAFTHLVITRSGNTVKSYINGVLKDTSTTTLSGTIPSTANRFRLGCDSRSGTTILTGRMSDFRLYATALSADDVLRLYNVGGSVAKNGVMMGYQMKED